MPVYDRSYRRWDGELKKRAMRFAPITAMGVRNAVGMKGNWLFTLALRLFMVGSIIPTLLLFFFNYASAFKPSYLPGGLLMFLEMLEPYRPVQYPLLTRMNVLFLMVYTVLFGSGLIAKDRATGALPLYLSRPLTLADYVIGKAGVIAWFVAAFTLLPNLLLWVFGVMTDPAPGAFGRALPWLGPIVLQNAAVIAVYSFTMLAVSSLCRRPMFAGLIWFTLFVILPVLAVFLSVQLEMPALAAISPNDALFALGNQLFDIEALFEQALNQSGGHEFRGAIQAIFGLVNMFASPGGLAWVSVLTWSGGSLLVLLGVLRRQDVVAEAATR